MDRIENDQLPELRINRHIFKQSQECTALYVNKMERAEFSQ
jgi:hypothetical protein